MGFYPDDMRDRLDREFLSTNPQSVWGKTQFKPYNYGD